MALTGPEESQNADLTKGVAIQAETEEISPTLIARESPKAHRASLSGKKLSGRPAPSTTTSFQTLSRQISSLKLDQAETSKGDGVPLTQDPTIVLAQVATWLQEEKAKRSNKRSQEQASGALDDDSAEYQGNEAQGVRTDVQGSENVSALDKLEQILAGYAVVNKEGGFGHGGFNRSPFAVLRKSSMAKKLKPSSMTITSDTDYDGELLVPNIEATLDNSKTVSGGQADADTKSVTDPKDKENWMNFKREIVRLTHTLKLKRWRRVPIESGGDISVERLSGALTNAVYVVSPPKQRRDSSSGREGSATASAMRPPPKLLLRIYGPQAEYLIDRQTELSILRRLGKKNIGPRLLGTFTNGRFEEFLHAKTLTKDDLRNPETSKQIAKRMRELHDGIDLLEEERDSGPFVWVNWDKWLDRCEKIITWLDKRILHGGHDQASAQTRTWMARGFVCGVQWPLFRRTVDKYRRYIVDRHGGKKGIKQQLVFAHNDTQYGNVLRLQPSGESPLLQPKNEHKQLVVIDFEYASGNLPGFDFVNHFTEWCYDYHHPERSWLVNPAYYPTPEEQRRFVRAYVQHRPGLAGEEASQSTSRTRSATTGTNPVSSFMLDSRAPPGSNSTYDAEEKAREEAAERQVEALIEDARLWRGMCSAQWVAWGVVQAKIPEMEGLEWRRSKADKLIGKFKAHLKPQSDPLGEEVLAKQRASRMDRPEGRETEEAHREGDDEDAGEEEGFDYLAYAQDRALFFWGDCLQLGLVNRDELPEELLRKVKILTY